ncbi:hypothetical protein RND81_07G079800 [Saponaria officinalis]|uniref:rRNA processing protein EBP2 n=1 Tax=Saponaria officinalis TaxID=3572 RepID=A0AAW1JSZ7_SAPOF
MVVLRRQSPSVDADEMEDDELDTMGDVSESDVESDSDEEDGDVKLSEPSKTAIYNKDGILEKLNEIRWPEDVEWIHTLAIDIDLDQEVDVNDDLARETAIYTQALHGTREAYAKLESRGQPYLRPSDYYAEMVKSDTHMEKVKKKLLVEKKELEEQEQRRKDRENKRFAKQVQAEKQKERSKDKKEQIESVKKWRKQREKSGFADNKDEMGLSFEDGSAFNKKGKKPTGVSPGDRSGGKGRFGMKGKKGSDKNKKDSKFGFGGRKGMKKQNTAETTSDLRGFNSNSQSGRKKRRVS